MISKCIHVSPAPEQIWCFYGQIEYIYEKEVLVFTLYLYFY
jgi:hypothetical protein